MGKYLKVTYTERFTKRYRIVFFPCIALLMVSALIYWNKQSNNEKAFLKGLNLKLTLKVIAIMPTGNHGYGVIEGKVINSNKPENYSAVYQDKYTFCKTDHGMVLFVSDYYLFVKNDSVIINSKAAKYWVYRKGKLVSEYNLTFTTDDFLYYDIEKNRYFDFITYESHY